MLTALDLFAGAGGATQGLRDAGYRVLGAVENCADAVRTFTANHPAGGVLETDIRQVDPRALRRSLKLPVAGLGLITACPPCQSFSTLGRMDAADSRNDLISETQRFAREFLPAAVIFENVPGVARDPRFEMLRARLEGIGYHDFRAYDLFASDFGVPQRRRRLIAIALRAGRGGVLPEDLGTILPMSFPVKPPDAGDVIDLAGPIEGTTDPLHRARRPTPLVLERIRAIPPGGNRFDLPPHLRLECHKRIKRKGAWAPYGRIRRKGPAPTMTTKCTTPSCGRFVHPTEHRGISLREAALLQTFPPRYRFVGTHGSIERQIGNAVPVRLAEALGLAVKRCIETVREERAA